MNDALAIELETLVMPGEVISGHAEFESECSSCHTPFERNRQDAKCVECHQDIGSDQKLSRGFHGRDTEAANEDCAACHTEHKGRDANVVIFDAQSFQHKNTDFLLLDKHADVACEDCHTADQRYREAPLACIDCHREDDVHEGGLGEDCKTCHAPKGWEIVEFDHAAETSFPLEGGHSDTECLACHVEQDFTDTPSTCNACHKADDVHEGARGTDCAACHTASNWTESLFDHARETDFPLFGGHAKATCEQCHATGTVDVLLETTCVSCHVDDDVHDGLLGNDCVACHNETAWTVQLFKHDAATEFALRESHADLTCESCHTEPVHETNPGTTCIACHADDDPHAGQLGESCSNCHNETDWKLQVLFDHDFTSFPLIGNHKTASCDTCHESAQFQDAPSACIDCHQEEDIHEGSLGEDCGACHNPVEWSSWRFDHWLNAGFELDGAHGELNCADCHRAPLRSGRTTPSRCIDCHRQDDVHDDQFGKDCSRCHTTTTFRGAQQP